MIITASSVGHTVTFILHGPVTEERAQAERVIAGRRVHQLFGPTPFKKKDRQFYKDIADEYWEGGNF